VRPGPVPVPAPTPESGDAVVGGRRRNTMICMVASMPATIVVEDVRKRYGETRAVDGVSFEVDSGEFFGILGPNGAGKTTLLEIIEGLREADSGKVSLLGSVPWPRDPHLLPRIGVQLQASSFFERLTTREQIRTFAALYGVADRAADEMLDVVGLADKAETRTERLSGGQAQRLSIACALVHSPDVVFLDEPTAALDPQARRNLWDLLREISRQGRTVVLTTHYMDEAEILCDRVAIMDTGKVLELGAPATLVRGLDAATRISVEHGVLPERDAQQLFPEAEITDDGVSLTIATRSPAVVLSALAERQALRGLAVRSATLEDVFLTLTGREYRA
jgi:ABC-2 type transport system ATP-binding protein